MDLDKVMDMSLGDGGAGGFGVRFLDRLLSRFRRPDVAMRVGTTLFWQAFLSSDAYPSTLVEYGIAPSATEHADPFIVHHGRRQDLILFDPAHSSRAPTVIPELNATRDDITQGWHHWLEQWQAADRPPKLWKDMWVNGELPFDIPRTQQLGIVVARAPRVELTAGIAPGVVCVERHERKSTGGVVVQDKIGRPGITAALHAMLPEGLTIAEFNAQAPRLVGETASINGVAGMIHSVDIVSDSCFVAVDELVSERVVEPMSGMGPGAREPVSFRGLASSHKKTFVTGYSPEIPLVQPGLQLRVLTRPVTQRGDSGAALINGSGKVLGFAFCRTGFDEPIEFAAWIWAEQVLLAHGLS